MLLPFMGLFLIFIPVGGVLAGIVLLFLKRFDLLPLAVLAPLLGSFGVVVGLFGTGIGLEELGFQSRLIVNTGALLGSVMGALIGLTLAFAVSRFVARAIGLLKHFGARH